MISSNSPASCGRRTVWLAIAWLAAGSAAFALSDVTQPGDPILASSANSPGSEGVGNAIDGQPTKYLNFDSGRDGAVNGFSPSGFVVSPSVGITHVTGMVIQSANDAPERDPKIVLLEGSNDEAIESFGAGNWEEITTLEFPAFTARFESQTLFFENLRPYRHYRWTVLETSAANTCCMQVAEVELLGTTLPTDVTQPGDTIFASSANSPGSEGVANAIDGQPTKYLNFDSGRDGAVNGFSPSGFAVSPSIGRTLVTGISMQSANDAPERDPRIIIIEGSHDETIDSYSGGTWEEIVTLEDLPAFTARFQTQTFLFENYTPYRHYRWTVLATAAANTCCMQIAEVELLGTGAPQDVTQPGDTILASSANSPGSEGVGNAIDNQPTKYLNFDSGRDGAVNGFSPSGFVVTPSVGATTVIGLTLQSANDAPERDPRIVLLEGSNDDSIESFNSGNWEEIVTLEDIPDFTARFQVQEFYFPNKKSYKHYRWTVLATAAANTCCMQIAEVELLAATTAVDCDRARFLVQPVDTLVLPDASATFFTTVNGPWPLQWHVNGEPIPGATSASYTTPPVTAANADNVYTVQIRGCEVSLPVQAVLFTPSATRSIGISFRGGGANGSPTVMNETDVAGLHPQAYWVNATGAGTGFLPDDFSDPPIPVVDSDNAPSTITVEWTSSGTWGSGTGDASSTQRMLNGLNHANPGTEGSITFANVPAGNHAVIAYFVGIPLQFQDADYTITGQASETYNVRVINADEYNAAPGFYRGISKDANDRSLATYVRFDNVQPASGVVTLTWNTLTTGFDRGAPVNAVQLILNATPAGAPPVITAQPQPSIGPAGGSVSVSVTATGENLTYQWRKNGRNLPDGGNVSGATSATLTLSSLSEDDNGIYNVAIFNPGGSVVSRNVSVRVSEYDIAADLVGYWKFDESAGTTAANAATGGQAGEVIGSPSWGAGRVANSLSLDGGTYVFVPSYPRAGREISVSGWVNLSETGTDVAIVRNAQGALGVGLGAGQFELGLILNPNDGVSRLSGAIGAGPNIVRVTAPDAFTFGSWQHIAMSADGAQLRLFVNGTQVGSADYITAINAPAIPYLSMGARLNIDPLAGIEDPEPDFSFPNLMIGRLDDLGLWTRGLTTEEVQKVFAAGQQGQPLTSVVLEPPATGGTLSIGAAAGNITVTWDAGRLQTAPSAAGPWTDAVGTSPLTEPAGDAARFYRTVSP